MLSGTVRVNVMADVRVCIRVYVTNDSRYDIRVNCDDDFRLYGVKVDVNIGLGLI